MPDPKDYLKDDKHSYVRSYVRRKRIEKEQTPEPVYYGHDFSWLIIASWVIHIAAMIMATIFSLSGILSVGWRILSCFVFGLLLFILIFRVFHWLSDR